MICVATLVFKGAGASALRGDFYRPCGDGPFPAVVAVPGGGWLRGRRQALRFWGEQLAMAGLAFFAIEVGLLRDYDLFGMFFVQIKQVWRVCRRDHLNGLTICTIVVRESQSVHSFLYLTQQPRVNAMIGLFEAHNGRRLF